MSPGEVIPVRKEQQLSARGVIGWLCLAALLTQGRVGAAEAPVTLEGAYPGVVAGILSGATLGELPEGVVLRAGDIEITGKALDEVIAESPRKMREQLRKYALYLLDEMTAEKLLLSAAKKAAAEAKKDIARKADREVIGDYVKGVGAQVKVTEAEVADFYEKNKDMCGGAKLDQVKSEIEQMLLKERQQQAVGRHIRELAKAAGLTLSAAWAKDQVALSRDNPVDKARTSGKPSLVDFGATGCRPCDMLAPILKTLRKKFEGKLNVLFVHVGEEQILASLYGVQSIPVQVFYNKDGKEVLRHVGFMPQDEIEKALAEMGVN
jgi:thioredoxin 1